MPETMRVSFLSALLVGEFQQDRLLVREVFRAFGWRLFEAQDRKRAKHYLRYRSIQVAIADCEVLGWDWKHILRELREFDPVPQLIVASRTADDRLWAEVLNLGAYDVLARPFERDELERVVAAARRQFDPLPRRATARLAIAGAA